MAPSNTHYLASITKLSGLESYQNWKFGVGLVLRREGYYDVVTGKTERTADNESEWDTKAEEALTIIGLTVHPSQYVHIRKASNGREAWKALADVYEKDSRATRISLKRQIYGFKHDPAAPMQDYISGITDLADQLGSIGKGNELSVKDITDILIFNLHESYSNIAASLTATKGDLAIADVTGALLDEEGRRSGSVKTDTEDPDSSKELSTKETAFLARISNEFTCFNCGKPGHLARSCRSPRKGNRTEYGAAAHTAWDDADDLW